MEYITGAERDQLASQLAELVGRRKMISTRIAEARELGDLKENAEYHAAREDQGLNEAKIRELEHKLSTSVVAESDDVPEDMVFIGATVRLKDVKSGDEEIYRLVGATSGALEEDVIEVTPASPLGEALMKSRVGETIRVDLRRGPKRFEIVGLE